jgi:CRISPR-associated protein Csm3
MKLLEIKRIEGIITLKSGLHIGSGNMEMHIGGTDNPVIVHPHTRRPYIPGSSIKGKVRSLLEMKSGLMVKTGGAVLKLSHLEDLQKPELTPELTEAKGILKIFGSSPDEKQEDSMKTLGPTRVSFSDCPLNEKWLKKADDNQWQYLEVKSENSINRIKGTAENPRFTERVPEGAQFDLLITFKVFENDDKELFKMLLTGLKLLEMDALGGSGSRGYGRIKIELLDEQLKKQFEELNVFAAV